MRQCVRRRPLGGDLGELIADCRDEIVLTTKVVSQTGDDVNQGGASRRHIQIAVEESLRRLKTDRIDVYFLHHYDAETPVEEMLRALDDLVRQGKILYPAVSNWAAWQVMKAQGIAARDRAGAHRMPAADVQPGQAAGGSGDLADGGE